MFVAHRLYPIFIYKMTELYKIHTIVLHLAYRKLLCSCVQACKLKVARTFAIWGSRQSTSVAPECQEEEAQIGPDVLNVVHSTEAYALICSRQLADKQNQEVELSVNQQRVESGVSHR
jgi:hypothetical protein